MLRFASVSLRSEIRGHPSWLSADQPVCRLPTLLALRCVPHKENTTVAALFVSWHGMAWQVAVVGRAIERPAHMLHKSAVYPSAVAKYKFTPRLQENCDQNLGLLNQSRTVYNYITASNQKVGKSCATWLSCLSTTNGPTVPLTVLMLLVFHTPVIRGDRCR